MSPRILIVGGYGTFGRRAAERLGRDGSLAMTLAGRNAEAGRRAVAELQPLVAARLDSVSLDAARPDMRVLGALAPAVILNAAGPYQAQDYTLARAAVAIGAHYVDLADARAFVCGIGALDAEAKARGVTVVSGASSVPGLSSAVIDHHLASFATLTSVRYGIVPANGFDPGIATTASILSYVGRPFRTLDHGKMVRVYGWQDIGRHTFAGLGPRWLARCDIPDLALLPARYPSLQQVDFRAGLEVPLQHFGLWALSWIVRAGLLRRPERLAEPLVRLKGWMSRLGSDAGGMFMVLEGTGHDARPRQVSWHVIARANQGPYIPQVAATIVVRKLLAGTLAARGAMPCLGLMTLPEFEREIADLAIEMRTD